jgi:hypothetical protein
MKTPVLITALMIVAPMTPIVSEESWPQVESRYRRCEQEISRAGEEFRRLQAALDRLSAQSPHAHQENGTLVKMFNMQNALRGRIERVSRQSERLRNDIRQARRSSSACPSCIVSSLGLLCRQSEDLDDDIDELRTALRETTAHQTHESRAAATQAIDSVSIINKKLKSRLDEVQKTSARTDDRVSAVIARKAAEHFEQAAHLLEQGDTVTAIRELNVTRKLIATAEERVGRP